MSEESYTLLHDAGAIEYPGSTLLVAIDETGHENFADPNYPVFGIGGCAFLLKHSERIVGPWLDLKARSFGSTDVRMHAADLRNPTKDQLDGLATFFTTYPFFRLAVMAASTIKNTSGHPLIQLVCRALWDRICNIADVAQPTAIIVSVEDSTRLGKTIWAYLSGYEIGSTSGQKIVPKLFLAKKSLNHPFMEIADFVLHPAGALVRNRVLGRSCLRRDFEIVFRNVDARLSHHMKLLEFRTPPPNETA
jgi:hypothetical protein